MWSFKIIDKEKKHHTEDNDNRIYIKIFYHKT